MGRLQVAAVLLQRWKKCMCVLTLLYLWLCGGTTGRGYGILRHGHNFRNCVTAGKTTRFHSSGTTRFHFPGTSLCVCPSSSPFFPSIYFIDILIPFLSVPPFAHIVFYLSSAYVTVYHALLNKFVCFTFLYPEGILTIVLFSYLPDFARCLRFCVMYGWPMVC